MAPISGPHQNRSSNKQVLLVIKQQSKLSLLGSLCSKYCVIFSLLFIECTRPQLHPVTVAEFSAFIDATDYVTEAEQYGWSILQLDVMRYDTSSGLYWKLPDGKRLARDGEPVTQVSYNDAIAYCTWSGTSLPTYDEYWAMIEHDHRPIVFDTDSILPVSSCNIRGNVWELTSSTDTYGNIRLAGGSLFCNPNTCNGTNPDRRLFVDPTTANVHIGFAVVK